MLGSRLVIIVCRQQQQQLADDIRGRNISIYKVKSEIFLLSFFFKEKKEIIIIVILFVGRSGRDSRLTNPVFSFKQKGMQFLFNN